MKRLATYSVNPEIQQILIQTANYRQGSIVALVKQNGTVSERYSYDAWGRRRNPANWADYNVPAPRLIARGYTGHEHLDGFGLINMNGRMYDPVIGRVLSPDAYVQAPGYTQSYNRYSYCMNNPLRYTDPSGWFASASGDNATFNISNAWADRINDVNSYIYTSAYTADNGGGGGSWTNWIHDEYTNYMLMGSGAFNRMYGNGASSVARSLASNPSATNQWRQGLLSIESVRQAGGYYAQVAYTQKYSGPSTITKDGIVYTISPATGGVANKWISIGTKGQGGATPSGQGDGNETFKHVLEATGLGADAMNTPISITKVVLKESGKALEGFTRSGTVIGAIAGGVPAAVHMWNNGFNWSDALTLTLAGAGVASEFFGVGELWDSVAVPVTIGVTVGTVGNDMYNILKENKTGH